ncbi:HDOD domain family [Verrucomicrobiia bacterium DG1235]|nr:HDOD domain family [Verrucomicrobiae bacterium DG1235]
MTTRILLIDENFEALQSYRYALAPKAKQWTFVTAENAEEGLENARETKPDIVIAALSVDDGHGAQILAQIEHIAPQAQCFITATDAEKPLLQESLGANFQFLPSPCPPSRLVTEIQRCVAIDTWLGNDRIKQLVSQMGEFPSLPPIYVKVVNALNSRDASAETIAHAIAGDLAISAKVLQTVNSSFYGFDAKISNIAQAVGILGIDCVKNLVLAIQVFNKMGRSADQKAITDQLWHHSMSVATTARRIAAHESKDEKAAEEAYSAGLMHDIGKLVLLNAAPEQFAEARQLAREKNTPLWQAENDIIGCNHAEVGAYLLARWGMPASLTEAVALHHEPINSFGKSFSALAAVHVANAIVHERHKADHPDAKTSEDFLIEIGKSEEWETWKAVASGKTPRLKLTPKTSASTAEAPSPSAEADSDESPSEESLQPKQAVTASEEEPKQSKSRLPIFAIAACLALAAVGIYTLNTVDNPEPIADIEEGKTDDAREKSSFANSIDTARELSGLKRTEDALQEIIDSQEETLATKEPVAPEIEKPAEPDAKPEPQVAAVEPSPAPAKLPKPKLPEVKDSFPKIQLSGIFYNPDKPLASINGKIRRVGDTVSGAKIVRIEKSLIVVQYENTLRSYKLN